MNYYDNDKETIKVLKYQTMDPNSEKAKYLLGQIITEAKSIIEGVYYTHFRNGYNIDKEYAIEIVNEQLLKTISKFDPCFINSKGKTATLFSYISLVAKNSIRWKSIANLKERSKEGYYTVELDNELIGDDDPHSSLDIEDFKHRYEHLFTKNNYKSVWDWLVDFLENNGTNWSRYNLAHFVRLDYKKLKRLSGEPMRSTAHASLLFNNIIRKIKEYEENER